MPKPNGITALIETVTPELALDWLTANTHNRPPKPEAIHRYAADMTAGEWDLNGEPVRFDVNGVLLDGQNRLYASIEAGVPFQTLVVRGLPPESQMTMDVGVRRLLGDYLHLQGHGSANDKAAVLAMYWRWEVNPDLRLSRGQPTIHQATDLMARHPGLLEHLPAASTLRRNVQLRVSVGASLMYITSGIDADDAEAFWDRLRTGAGLPADDPVLLLRDALRGTRHRDLQKDYVTLWALTAKAWNLYRDGTTAKVLAWRRGGASPEPYPVPR